MNSLTREAARCRSEARRFAGKAEEPFLLRMSDAFEELAHHRETDRSKRCVRSLLLEDRKSEPVS